MGGAFPDFGINVFLNKELGVGWTASWRGNTSMRASNTVPCSTPSMLSTNPRGYTSSGPCRNCALASGSPAYTTTSVTKDLNVVPGCPSSHYFVGHVAVAARVYMTSHIFLRPAVDVQYVKDFSPFGTNWVPRYSMSLGYSLGKE